MESDEETEEEQEEEPEEEPQEGPAELVADLDEEEVEGSDADDSDAESKVINLLYMARVPPYRMGPNGPTPPLAYKI